MVHVYVEEFDVDYSALDGDAAKAALVAGGVPVGTLIYLVDVVEDIHILGDKMKFEHSHLTLTARVHMLGKARAGPARLVDLRSLPETGKFSRALVANRGIVGVPAHMLTDCEGMLILECSQANLTIPVWYGRYKHVEYLLTKDADDRVKLYSLYDKVAAKISRDAQVQMSAALERQIINAQEQEILDRIRTERNAAQAQRRLEEDEEATRRVAMAETLRVMQEEARVRQEAAALHQAALNSALLRDQAERTTDRARRAAAVTAAQAELTALHQGASLGAASTRVDLEMLILESMGLDGTGDEITHAREAVRSLLRSTLSTWTATQDTEHPAPQLIDSVNWILRRLKADLADGLGLPRQGSEASPPTEGSSTSTSPASGSSSNPRDPRL